MFVSKVLKLKGQPFFKTSFTSCPSISIIAFECDKSVTAKFVSFNFCEIILSESLTNLDLIGFLITSIGVYIATRD